MALKLLAELGLDGTGFIHGLRSAEERAKGVMEGIKGFVVQAIGVYTLERALHKTVETATELVNTSRRLGVGTEQLQVLRKAAEEAGTEMGAVTNGFEKLELARQKALTPGASGRDARIAFQSLGVGIDQLRSMSAAQLFMGPMAKKMQDANSAEMTTVLREIFGKGAGELVDVLKTDFGDLEEELKKMGAIMSTETAVKLKQLNESLEMFGTMIIAHLAPVILQVIDGLIDGISKFLGWIDSQVRGGQDSSPSSPDKPGFLGKAWAGTKGAVQGLLWFWDEELDTLGIGPEDQAALRYQQSQENFKKAGLEGGFLNDAADALVKQMNQGKPGLKGQWDSVTEAWRKRMQELADRLNNPKPPEGGFQGNPLKMTKKALEVPSDSLTRVGNFLGGSQAALQRLAQQRTDLLRRIERNTRHPRTAGTHGGPFGSMVGRNQLLVPEI